MTSFREMPLDRLETQARVCAEIVQQTMIQSLLIGKPADRCLKDAFYANRQFGSRDRRLISESLFSVLRWWGWLRYLAPPAFTEAWQEHQESTAEVSASAWYAALVGAWLLESPEELPPAVRVWAAALEPADMELNFPPREASWEEKWQSLAPLFYPTPPVKRDWQDLFPDWIKTYLAAEEKVELRVLLKWLQTRPPLWLRAQISDVNWLCNELSEQGATVIRHPKMKFALRCEAKSLNLRAMSTFRQGDFEIQDLASQTVAMICDPKPGEQWWDACAGGGGKTLHLAWLMQGKGSVLASDIRAHKLEELKLRARRAQFPNIRCKEWKGKEMPKWKDRFAGVLVDTPCSCSGTWRRNPDARWNSRAEELTEFNRLQLQLLNNAAAAVAPGGTLVYSTCSMFKTENQDVVTTFLAENPQFSLCPFCCPLSGRESDGMRQIWPWDGDCDAMFTAKMRRT